MEEKIRKLDELCSNVREEIFLLRNFTNNGRRIDNILERIEKYAFEIIGCVAEIRKKMEEK